MRHAGRFDYVLLAQNSPYSGAQSKRAQQQQARATRAGRAQQAQGQPKS